MSRPAADPPRHHAVEDALAIGMGALLVSVGLQFYAQATLLTGGVAGAALLLHYATGHGFDALFVLINLPFYVLAVRRMGWKPAIRTFIAVALVSWLMRMEPDWMGFAHLSPVFAAVAGGGAMGVGLLILFRHRTGLGGVNLVALYIQERIGWRAGYVQLGIDATIMAAALLFLPPGKVALSLAGTAIMNLVLAINHRPGRYLAISL
ncbi:YitT family protein [Neoroseomonas alba]